MSKGLVVMAYGTPAGPAQIEQYYTHIRGGRPPEPKQLAELEARYEAIGGISPLTERTCAQLDAIAAGLEESEPGQWHVRLGQKHAHPFIEDGVTELLHLGVSNIVGLVLTPHFSSASVGQYHARAASATSGSTTAAGSGPVAFLGVDSWHMENEYLDFQADALRSVLDGMPTRTKVVFTAHSLPERVLVDDLYVQQLHESASATAARAGISQWAGWGLGWQSAGRTPEPWRGPDVLEIIDDLAETGRSDALVVVPQGFTSDHLEVLYDLDIEASAAARRAGLAFGRTRVPNDDPGVIAALTRRVLTAGRGSGQ